MNVGQEASSTARAASAGFIKLQPRPPNICLTSRMATALPTRIIHQGAVEGRFSARITPVTAADRSLMRMGFLPSFCQRSSRPTQNTTDSSVTRSACQPKSHTPAMTQGMSAVSTSSISDAVLSF